MDSKDEDDWRDAEQKMMQAADVIEAGERVEIQHEDRPERQC